MARPLRIEFEGAWYHVVVTGNAGDVIFSDDGDKRRLLTYLTRAHERFGVCVHAYCLLEDRFHLIIETPQANLSHAMQFINASYTTFFNHKYKRSGHLLKGRYEATVIDQTQYAKDVGAFLHLQPVACNACVHPAEYEWSSYEYYVSEKKCPQFLCVDFTLKQFAPIQKEARQKYEKWIEETITKKITDPSSAAYANIILGSQEFIAKIYTDHAAELKEKKDIPCARALLKGPARFERLEEKLLADENIDQRMRKKIMVYCMRRFYSGTTDEMNKYFGKKLSAAAYSKITSRLEAKIKEEETLQEIIERVRP